MPNLKQDIRKDKYVKELAHARIRLQNNIPTFFYCKISLEEELEFLVKQELRK